MRLPSRLQWTVALLAGAAIVRTLSKRERRFDGAVFITGGSRGLGLAIAQECARRGASVAIAARDEAELEDAKHLIQPAAVPVRTYVCDVRDGNAVRDAVLDARSTFGRLDMLINNAGTIEVGPMQVMTQDDYRDSLDTHFWGMYYAVEAVRPLFERARAGRIVNITSIGGKISVPHLLPYSVGKFAAVGYSEGLRAELARMGISVTTVVPGLMRTGSPRNAFFKGQNEKEYAWFALSDTLPGFSIGARAAAKTIVSAALAGRAEVILSKPAQFGALAHGIAPGLVTNALGLVNRALPKEDGIGKRRATGAQSESGITRSPLTTLGRKAEQDFNQL